MLENGVVLLMGLQIRRIVASVDPHRSPAINAFSVGLPMTAVIIVVRFLFVGPLLLWPQRDHEHKERRNRRFAQAIERVRGRASQDVRLQRCREYATRISNHRVTDLTQLCEEGFGWKGGVILSWSGIRGVVTLAAAQSLPKDGSFPHREPLILVAFTVAITTLLLQGGTLPWLIRASGIRGTDKSADA